MSEVEVAGKGRGVPKTVPVAGTGFEATTSCRW
jgi:hypothetical protein